MAVSINLAKTDYFITHL